MEEKKKLVNHPDFEIYKPDRITVKGFLIAVALVIAIIFITLGLASLGN
jgi:hypothetical protein